jgi:CRISPR-associated protein Csb2
MSKLVVEVRFHDGRYHGVGEAFPSPGRLFQALVAATSTGVAPPTEKAALEWLERQEPPTVALPRFRLGQALTMFVPHNDADAKTIEDIRAKKTQQPWFFDVEVPFVYCWDFDAADRTFADGVCRAALGLYQFGRGIDQAYANACVVDDAAVETLFERYPGDVLVPRAGSAAKIVSVPQKGSLSSLLQRHHGTVSRIQHNADGDLFVQAPKARFDRVAYNGAERWLHFELAKDDGTGFVAWPLDRACELVKKVRQAARARLDGAVGVDEGQKRLPMQNEPASPQGERLRFILLPSRGHDETSPSIRRVVVGVPLSMLLADAEWLFSALVVDDARLVGSQDTAMWQRYTQASTSWQTVTPAILTPRRRLEPTTRETKNTAERQKEEQQARHAVLQALRQAEVKGVPVQIDVQREPWEKRGKRAEVFAEGSRFEKEKAWHVRITFAQPVTGPVTVGDGRFAGLGVMAPPLRDQAAKRVDGDDVIVLSIDAGLEESASPTGIADAFRRALMARTQERLGNKVLPAWLTGHLPNGETVRDDRSRLRLVADLERQRLLALIPMFGMREGAEHRDDVIDALSTMHELKAGAGGRLLLRRRSLDDHDVLFARGRRWRTVNDYLVNRHDHGRDLHALVVQDVKAECARQRLPVPHVEVLSTNAVKATGVFAELELTFAVDVVGPILLGRNRMLGGGLLRKWPVE